MTAAQNLQRQVDDLDFRMKSLRTLDEPDPNPTSRALPEGARNPQSIRSKIHPSDASESRLLLDLQVQDSIDLNGLIKLFVNHRPVFPLCHQVEARWLVSTTLEERT